MKHTALCHFGFHPILRVLVGCLWASSAVTTAEVVDSPPTVIRNIQYGEEGVRIAIDFQIPWSWENIRFKSRQTFPNFIPALPPTRHQLSFGQSETGKATWLQFDFIMIGDYAVDDPHTVRVDFMGGSTIVGRYDPVEQVLEFDGLEYDPVIRVPDFRLLKSHDMVHWEIIESNGVTTSETLWPSPVVVTLQKPDQPTTFYKVEYL